MIRHRKKTFNDKRKYDWEMWRKGDREGLIMKRKDLKL